MQGRHIPEPIMTSFRQCFSWWCVASRVQDPAAFFRSARAIGYAGIELLPVDLWPVAIEAGLAIVSSDGHASIAEGLNRRENHARIETEIGKKLDLAAKFNIPNLICFAGSRLGLSDAQGAINTADGLSRLAPMAEQAGVTLALELLNSKVDHVDYQCDHTAWGVMVCRMVNSPRVRLLYDIYHMQIMEGDVIRTLRDNLPWVGHIHTAGNPGRHEIDDTQELNYRPIMRMLADAGYTGYVGQEFVPVRDPLASLREAFEICDVA
jgi:hydroxypyruvate isomerase